jgi:hypothetical protein
MATKSSSTTSTATAPQSELGSETLSIEDFRAMEEIINRRQKQGEYNVDAKDMLAMAKVIYNLLSRQ